MKRNKILFIVGLSFLLILVLGAAYAYFQININNNTTNSTVLGTTNKYGTVTLTTNTTKLYLKLTSDEMTEDKKGTIYYANSDSTGTPLTTNPNYILATASLADGDLPLDCTYNFKVTATVKNTITDGSDEDVKITIGNTTKTLKELTDAGTNGVVITGTIKNLVTGESQTIGVSSTLLNSNSNQGDLQNNSYTINIIPYNNGGIRAFSYRLRRLQTIANYLINDVGLWQSGLEGDGYRYVGSGAVGESTNPNNFICFGTISKFDCTENPDKYMYRIIGVFPDESGDQHVKLIKYTQLRNYLWNTNPSVDISWEESALYNGLNGNYFFTNSNFDYLQNNTWLNKISNWTWSAVNTLTSSNSGPKYNELSSKEMYLHEMNKSTKTSAIGNWTTPLAKIGLMYVSDYTLSLGSSALALTTGTVDNSVLLKTGWMHQNNNDYDAKDSYEWTISRDDNDDDGYYRAWKVLSNGLVYSDYVFNGCNARPVFYLDSSVKLNASSGDGSLNNPYILQ